MHTQVNGKRQSSQSRCQPSVYTSFIHSLSIRRTGRSSYLPYHRLQCFSRFSRNSPIPLLSYPAILPLPHSPYSLQSTAYSPLSIPPPPILTAQSAPAPDPSASRSSIPNSRGSCSRIRCWRLPKPPRSERIGRPRRSPSSAVRHDHFSPQGQALRCCRDKRDSRERSNGSCR